MKTPKLTAAERTGLILLAIAMAVVAAAMILHRKPDAAVEQPAVPVAVDSLIHQLPRADSIKPSAPKKSKNSTTAPRSRNHRDELF